MTPPTDPTRWPEIKRVFEAALDEPAPAREAFLEAACRQPDGAPDPELRAAVDTLLRADADAEATALTVGGFLAASPLELGGLLDGLGVDLAAEPLPEAAPGTRIGPYRVIRLLGRGGMGEVYLAARADGLFERTVALKCVRADLAPGVAARFATERQILADLVHPGIARLYAAGVDSEAGPWLALELVDGVPITEAARELAMADRLELFVDVAEAIHHAHRRLVVHQDLKPSNVLVTDGEEGRQIKLLDFGIATILSLNAESEGRRGQAATRAYAAPEQLRGEATTTATDVYGLGVLLYEVLTGRRAFRGTTSLDGPPSLPSTVTDPAAGGLEPRQLEGDLDAICRMALAPEPDARYPSAEALATDLRRALAHQPVTARPPSAAYRTRRYLRRHRVAVLMAALVVLGLALGTGFYTVRLSAERDRAQTEAAKAQQTSDVLLSLFDRDPLGDATRSDTLSLRAFLAESERAIEGQLDGQPDVEADVLALLSRLYVRLGRYDQALPLARRALALRRGLPNPSPSALADAHTAVAEVLVPQGDYDAAEAHYLAALDLQRADPDASPRAIALALGNVSTVYNHRGRGTDYEDALATDLEALRILRKLLGDDHLEVAEMHNGLAVAYYNLDRTNEGIVHARRALAIRRAHLGDHPLVANTLNNLAVFVEEVGDMDEAVALYREAIRIWIAAHGPRHPDVSPLYSNLSDTLGKLGRLREASAMRDSALVIDRATLPPDHPFIARGLVAKGRLELQRGRSASAVAVFREAVQIYATRADLPEAERTLADAELGLALVKARQLEEARRILTRAQRAMAERLPEPDALQRQVEEALASIGP